MRKRKRYKKKNYQFLKKYFLSPLCIGLLISLWVGQFITISGPSMEPTFYDGDHAFVFKLVSHLERGNIVVARGKDGVPFYYIIKRVVGVPGDTIEFKNHNLYVNGKISNIRNYQGIESYGQDKYILNDEEYFLVGDNFQHSVDSREKGVFYRGEIVGKVKK